MLRPCFIAQASGEAHTPMFTIDRDLLLTTVTESESETESGRQTYAHMTHTVCGQAMCWGENNKTTYTLFSHLQDLSKLLI